MRPAVAEILGLPSVVTGEITDLFYPFVILML